MAKVDVLASSVNQRWVTPYTFFDKVHAEFGFCWDCAAEAKSSQVGRFNMPFQYFGPDHPIESFRDALAVNWAETLQAEGLTGPVWCNPPYGRTLGAWMKKFHQESERITVVALVYARTETKWFHQYVWDAAEIRFLEGRLTFMHPDTLDAAPAGATAGHMLVIWTPETFGHRNPTFVSVHR